MPFLHRVETKCLKRFIDMDKKCGFCEGDMTGKPARAVYCSGACRLAAHRKRIALYCSDEAGTAPAPPSAPLGVTYSIQPTSAEGVACLDEAIEQLNELRAKKEQAEEPFESGLSAFQLALRKKRLGY